jgi:hypothetical protein
MVLVAILKHKFPIMTNDQVFTRHWVEQLQIKQTSWALVAHACNPSYSGGRDQEDRGSKPVWANSSWDPISKNPSHTHAHTHTHTHTHKIGLVECLKCRPWIQAPELKKNPKKQTLASHHEKKHLTEKYKYWC